ncbi:hypothetical protein LCGC14_2972710, partial [marine sediment metagenome]
MCGLITSVTRIKKPNIKIELMSNSSFLNTKKIRPFGTSATESFTELQTNKSLFSLGNHIR